MGHGLNKDSSDYKSINVYELTGWDDNHLQLDKLESITTIKVQEKEVNKNLTSIDERNLWSVLYHMRSLLQYGVALVSPELNPWFIKYSWLYSLYNRYPDPRKLDQICLK